MNTRRAQRIGLGLAALGRPAYLTDGRDHDLGSARSVEDMRARTADVLDAAYAGGVRYLDAARSYGRAEEFLADWLSSRPDTTDVEVASGFPLKSWRLHLSCVRLDGSDSLVLVRSQQRRRAVPSFDVVEVLAPGDDDCAGRGAGAETMPGQHLMFEGGKERLRGGVIETQPAPAHRLHNPQQAAQFRDIRCRVG